MRQSHLYCEAVKMHGNIFEISFKNKVIWSSSRHISTRSAECITALTPTAYQPGSLPGVFRDRSPGRSNLRMGFPLRCFQRLSLPNIATLRCRWHDNRCTRGSSIPGPFVLRTASLKSPAPAADRDRTVSRRSEPSSRAALIGEQPNPWDLLQPQDATSRHRGAKPGRRYELLGPISLLSPEYLLSV